MTKKKRQMRREKKARISKESKSAGLVGLVRISTASQTRLFWSRGCDRNRKRGVVGNKVKKSMGDIKSGETFLFSFFFFCSFFFYLF